MQPGAQDVTFGEITCRELTVVDDEGKKSVVLYNDEDGGNVHAMGKDGGFASLGNDSDGGAVYATGKDGRSAQLYNDEDGGSMAIFNNGGLPVLLATVGDKGEGIITTKDKRGNQTGKLP